MEQPSAAKWNVLGSNDASFNDGTGIANLALNTTAISNPYKCSVYANAGQTMTLANTPYELQFNSKKFDTNNNFDTTTYKYTVPVNGFYYVAARAKGATIGSGNRIYLTVAGDDGTILSGNDIDGTGQYPAAIVCGLVQRTAAQTIFINIYCTTAGKSTQYDDTTSIAMQLFLVSRT